MTAKEVYEGSNGDVTKAFYAQLETHGPIGSLCVNLFRASKTSARAKVYRGGGYRSMSYDRKQFSMENLCRILLEHPDLGIRWGWKRDPAQEYHNWVLYVETPYGQVSFHTASRGAGPDYTGDWDGQHLSAERIIAFCDSVICGKSKLRPEPTDLRDEPPYPGLETCRISLADPEGLTVHVPTRRCSQSCPHAIHNCGEWVETGEVTVPEPIPAPVTLTRSLRFGDPDSIALARPRRRKM